MFYSASNGPRSFSIQNVVRRTYYVSALNGDDSNDGSESSPFSSISHAIDMSLDNDIIMVSEGVYDPISIYKYVTIIGEINKENVIIDGGGYSTCIFIQYVNYDERNFPVHISGLTVQNGFSYSEAGGISINNTLDVQLSDIHVRENMVSEDNGQGVGGIMIWYNSSAYLDNVLIEDNMGCSAGAIWIRDNGNLVMENSMVINNYTCDNGSEDNAGGIAMWDNSKASLKFVTMAFNQHAAIGIWPYEVIDLNVISSTFLPMEIVQLVLIMLTIMMEQ